MTDRQEIELRLAERRAELATLAGGEWSDEDEQRSNELRDEIRTLNTRLAALIASEPDPTEQRDQPASEAEDAEFRTLLGNVSLVEMFDDILAGRQPRGANAELQQHEEVRTNEIPLVLFEQRLPVGEDEARANSFPSEVQGNQQMTTPVVFPTPLASFVGVRRQRVSPGQSLHPVITAPNTSDGAVAAGSDQADTDWTISANALTPERLQRSFVWQREQAAQFPGLEADLRRLLSDNMADAMDRHMLRDSGNGIFEFGTDPTNVATVDTFASVQKSFYDRLDGRYADTLNQVRLVTNADAVQFFGGLYRGTGTDMSAADWIMDKTGGVRLSANAPATASTNAEGVFIRSMGGPHVHQPSWGGMELIRDEVTGSKGGTIKVTAVMLCAVVVVRTDALTRVKFDLS